MRPLLIPNGRISVAFALAGLIVTTLTRLITGNLSWAYQGWYPNIHWGRIELAIVVVGYFALPVAAMVYGISGYMRHRLQRDEPNASLAVWGLFLGIIGVLFASGLSAPLGK